MTAAALRNLGAAFLMTVVAAAPVQGAEDFPNGPMTMPAPGRTDSIRLLGFATEGGFLAYGPGGATTPLRLTGIQRQEARSVESGEIDLGAHEGRLIVVQGVPDGGWIYEAAVIETSGPLIAESVIRLLDSVDGRAGRPAQ